MRPEGGSGVEGLPAENILLCSGIDWLGTTSPARFRCEDYGQIILECSVHRFDYESVQAGADVGRSHGSNVIFMIFENVPNRASFLLSCHAATYGIHFRASNTKSITAPRSRRSRRPFCATAGMHHKPLTMHEFHCDWISESLRALARAV
jgi:hypothetical protein